MKQKLLSLIFVLTCLIGVSFAQNRQVSGVVTSASDGSPLAGVSVAVVGTSSATQTDGDGNYCIEVVGINVVLAFSYIGYDIHRVNLVNQSFVSVVLISFDAALDEVIVTAYGTQTKESIAGSISMLKSQDLEQVQTANVVQSLAGKLGGDQIRSTNGLPGEYLTVRFRCMWKILSYND